MEVLDYLKKLESAGYQAYIVGGFVRDKLLNIRTYDVDIATSARPEEVRRLFNIDNQDNIGCVSFRDGKYYIDITTYRRENFYFGHRPKSYKYINDIKKDLLRRDFTINTLCMNSNGEIIDYLGTRKDLDDRIIRVVGKTSKKLYQDPIRIVRALRFKIIYGLEIEDRALMYIIRHKSLINEISSTKIMEELNFILSSKNSIDGLCYLKNLNLLKYLGIDYSKDIVYVGNLYGMWAQMDLIRAFPFKKEESTIINNIKSILNKGGVDAYDIYKYGMKLCSIASTILGIDLKELNDINDKMNIHMGEELHIDGFEIKSILDVKDGKIIKDIKNDLIMNLLSGKLTNEFLDLEKYIIEKWK